MLALLVAVIAGAAIAYFGMQNISPVTIRLNYYVWDDVPLYLVIVGRCLRDSSWHGFSILPGRFPQR